MRFAESFKRILYTTIAFQKFVSVKYAIEWEGGGVIENGSGLQEKTLN